MTKTKKMYLVSGYTNAKTSCASSMTSDLKKEIACFVERYPRFKGKGQIQHAMCREVVPGLWGASAEDWQVMDTFESSKELKTYVWV